MIKQEIRNTFYWITWEVNSSRNITEERFLSKKCMKVAWKLAPGPFNFQGILCKKKF